MKNTIKYLIACVLLVAIASISAMAIDVNYSISEYDAAANQHDVYITVNNDGGCLMTFTTKFTFNNEKLILADCSEYLPIELTEGVVESDAPVFPAEVKSGKKTYSYNVQDYSWTTTGNKTTALITLYVGDTTTAEYFDHSALDICSVSFNLGEGVAYEDIAPEDFTVDYIYISDYNYGEFGYNEPTVATSVEFTNEVVTEVVVDEPETISVAAGSWVYFVDGTAVLYNEDTEVEVPAEAGLIYVNTGYDAHTVYAVDAEGVPTKVTGLDNAILGSAGANIRTSGVQGIRFRASVSNTAKDLGLATSEYEIAEYGFIVTAETNKTGFDSNSAFLGMNLVEAGKAKKGVAYNKADGTDIVFAEETDSTIFTNVVKNIPLTKSALQANIVSRPYYIVTDGETETVLYGELTKKSVYGVAVAIKEAAGADYTDNQDYIDNIISIVEGTQVAELTTEISIDISKLYE